MKTIVNIAGITDNSGSAPLTTYSNAVKTVIQTPNENGKRYRYPVRYDCACCCRPCCDCFFDCGCCKDCSPFHVYR